MKFIKYITVYVIALALTVSSGFGQTNQKRFSSTGSVFSRQNQFLNTSLLTHSSLFERKNYLRKMTEPVPGKQKKVTGMVLTALGAGLLATGIGLVATADSYSYTYSTGTYGSSSSGDLGGALGILAIPASAGLWIPGIVKWNKGGKMMKRYEEKNSIVRPDNSGNPLNKLWHLTVGSTIPVGKELSSVYGPGMSINTGFSVGILKNTIKIGPVLGIDTYRKSLSTTSAEKCTNVMFGATAGYLLRMNDKKTVYFYPGISIYTASAKDVISSGDKLPVAKGKGAALELKTNLVVKNWMLGISYVNFNPNVSYTDEVFESITKYNDLYPIYTQGKKEYKFDFSSIKFSVGIVL